MKCHLQRLLLRVEASLFERSHDFIALLNLETFGSDKGTSAREIDVVYAGKSFALFLVSHFIRAKKLVEGSGAARR